MREQVVAHKVGNRSGIGAQRRSPGAQRPTRRETGGVSLATRIRGVLGYVPAFLKLVLAVAMGFVIFAGYRAAASASFFQVHKIEVQGVSRISADDVQAIVRKEVEKTGVWKADLNGMNARLENVPWIKTAVVSRVLPDGMRVRITERVPRAVVRTASGRFRWVDEDAVLLGEMLPTDQIPAFFLRGLNEDDPQGARQENRERVAKFLELQQQWDVAGLSERVSEVNLLDLRDVRAQLAGDNSQIEVRLGSQDQGKRLQDALNVLDSQRQSAHGSLISYIDLSQGKRAIVGLTSGAHTTSDGPEGSNASSDLNRERKPDGDAVVPGDENGNADPGTRETKPPKDRSNKSATSEKKPDSTKKVNRRNR